MIERDEITSQDARNDREELFGQEISEYSYSVISTYLDRKADEGAWHGAQDEVAQIQRRWFQHVACQLIFCRTHDQDIGIRAIHGQFESSNLVLSMNLFSGNERIDLIVK